MDHYWGKEMSETRSITYNLYGIKEPINTFSKISVSSCIIQKGFICIFLCSLLSEFTIAYLDIIPFDLKVLSLCKLLIKAKAK